MAISLAVILLLGMVANRLFEKLKMPGLLGMLILGVAIGPHGLGLLEENMVLISGDLRKIALIIILLRAGLGIKKGDLKRNGLTALKMSAIPCLLEGFFIILASTRLLGFTFIEGGILGFILAAVSPAVVVPSMLGLIERGLGEEKGIASLILAGASIDDVFAITIFSTFLGLYSGAKLNLAGQVLSIPISVVLGILIGGIIGLILIRIFKSYKIHDTKKLLLVLGLAILLSEIEVIFKIKIQIASLLGVMAIGFVIMDKLAHVGEDLSKRLGQVWIFAQILLFVLVGAQVDVRVALKAGGLGLIIILIGLIGRSLGVIISLIGTDFTYKEKLFCVIAYIPKATVQAAIGGVPLALGVESGRLILAIAVLAIVITAPLGAIGINISAEKLLVAREKNIE